MTGSDAILDPEDARERWQQLPSPCTSSSPFSNPEFVIRLGKLFGWRCRSLFVAGAGIWIMQRRSGVFKEWVLAPFQPYSALRFESEAALNRLLEAVTTFTPGCLVSLAPGCTASNRLPKEWESIPRFTYLMEIDKGQTLWSRTPRRTFRLNEPDYELIDGEEALECAIRLSSGAYKSRGSHMALSPSQLISFSSGLVRDGMAMPLGVRHRNTGRNEAGLVILHGGDIAYSWIAGSIKGPAMTVLFGLALDRLATLRFRIFDLVGANTPSIAEFKRQFGGELTSYPHLTLGPHPLLTTSRKISRLFR